MYTTSHISRVMRAIRHQTGAPVPRGELTIDPLFAHEFLKWQGRGDEVKALCGTDLLMECCRSLGLDLVCIQSNETIDRQGDPAMHLNAINPIAQGGFFVFWVVNGAFQSTMARRGMMDLMTGIAKSADDVGNELRQLSGQVVATMERGVDAGAHGIIIADDIAYQRGTFMSPDFVEQYLVPIWQFQVNAARALGVPVFFHSDGNLNAVLPAIVAAGFDGLQCIEPAAGMDLLSVKRTYGRDLCLMGNLDPCLLSLPDGQDEPQLPDKRLVRAVKDLMACADSDGGLIFGTCSGLHAGMSPARVELMYRLASDWERRRQDVASNPASGKC